MDIRGESLAKEAFSEFLRRRGVRHFAWRRGNEPPDYGLRIGDASFAVEVTRVMEATSHGGVTLSTHGWRAALERFVAEIEQKAIDKKVLHGSYTMTVAPIPDFKARRQIFIAAALEYISGTQLVDRAPSHTIVKLDRGRSLTIAKARTAPSHVSTVILIGRPKWAIEARQDLTILMGKRIAEKRRLMRRLRRPRILLFVDSYVYSDIDDWATASAGINVSGFHTVARVAVRACQILHSENRQWRRAI